MINASQLIFTALAVLWLGNAQAGGNSVGNGGFAVVCDGKRPVTLDHWEVIRSQSNDWNLGPASYSWKRKVNLVAHRMTEFNARMADDLSAFIESHELKFVDDFTCNDKLIPIAIDYGRLKQIIPPNCRLLPAGTNIKNCQEHQAGEQVVLIKKDVFSSMDEDSKAALILHEFFYKMYSSLSSDSNLARANVHSWSRTFDKALIMQLPSYFYEAFEDVTVNTGAIRGVLTLNQYIAGPNSENPTLRISPTLSYSQKENHKRYSIVNVSLKSLEADYANGRISVNSKGVVSIETQKSGALRCVESRRLESGALGVDFNGTYMGMNGYSDLPFNVLINTKSGKNIVVANLKNFCLAESGTISLEHILRHDFHIFVDGQLCMRSGHAVFDEINMAKKCLEGAL
jgi:hypothetical protein